jgi:deoxyribodipyrimidine photo-lyase
VSTPVTICWLRRDLRLDDNAALYHALKSGHPVVPVFIFDTNILDDLEDKQDRRVDFIHQALQHIQVQLANMGSTLHVYTGTPLDCFKQIVADYNVAAVYTNHDYDPYAIVRDKEISEFLKSNGIAFHSYKDQVLFEKDEVVKDNSEPYTVYTPYSKKHKAKLNSFYLKPYPTENYFGYFHQQAVKPLPALEAIGFQKTNYTFQVPALDTEIAAHYHETRDIPSLHGTTHMGIHLRFGTISIRKLAAQAMKLNEIFLNELLWRDFYHMILWHFPKVVNTSFHEAYDNIPWRNNEAEFTRWCEGQTGYPIVDAGMRELNQTGFMHNRVRMIVANFLTKHLLIDWRWGEAYFSKKLLDYDLASNNGNWQWAAGCGCDAAPYFRVFNPYLQTEKFDPQHEYIKKWVPEYEQLSYPQPIVIHEEARERCLRVYKAALGKNQ